MPQEFDQYANEYEELLRDPIREKFAPGSKFFSDRKWKLIQDFFARQNRPLSVLRWLDVGCGKGELLRMGKGIFGQIAGCDLSQEMMVSGGDLDICLQPDPDRLPFADGSFDFLTAVCVFHHVEPGTRLALVNEMKRVLAPGGILGIFEHNPFNPTTRLIVSRTPVDQNAILLRAGETEGLMRKAALQEVETEYFLYLPEQFYNRIPWMEAALRSVPLGGQYATFGRNNAGDPNQHGG